ncbi:MAG: NUDIX hydrolase [Gammaproteobacteria bacterium]
MIVKSALLVIHGDWPESQLLLVREENKRYWLFPGGKQEPGESIEDALVREIREELAADVAEISNIGTVEGRTPDGTPLRMHLFRGSAEGELTPSNEITSLRWVKRADLPSIAEDLTPITVEQVFPFLDKERIW